MKVKNKSKGIINEFKAFVMRGNVVDLAVGVIIGAAFQAIINSFVNDLVSPLIGFIIGDVDFSEYSLVLKEATLEAEAVTLNYGAFITAVINFLLMAVCVFILVKFINAVREKTVKKEEEVKEVTTKICPFCKSEISLEATRCPHCTSEIK